MGFTLLTLGVIFVHVRSFSTNILSPYFFVIAQVLGGYNIFDTDIILINHCIGNFGD